MTNVEEELPILQPAEWFCIGNTNQDYLSTQYKVIHEFYANLSTVDWLIPLSTFCIQGKKILIDMFTINDNLCILNPSNTTFKVKLRASNLEWVVGILAPKGWATDMKWSSAKGMKSNYFSTEARVWLQLASHRKCPLWNITNVSFHQAIMVSCAPIRIWVSIMDELRYFYSRAGSTQDLFLSSLVKELF